MKPLNVDLNEGKGLSSWVLASLRKAILDGHFEPGEKLDQALIASELSVSRTPIREALKVLESEGFVEIHSYRGVNISKITIEDIHNIYEIRWIIESEITRQATPLIPDAELNRLEGLLKENEYDHKSWGERWHYEVDQEFHGTIMGFCQNKLFRIILGDLNNRIMRVRLFALGQSGTHLEISDNEHIDILSAMKGHDAHKAARMMELHLRNSAARIEGYLK